MPQDLTGFRVAVVATHGFEESELTRPVEALRQAGAEVQVLAPEIGMIQAFRHQEPAGKVKVDRALAEARPEEFHGLLLPGGALNADALRADATALDFVRRMAQAGKPMAAICHAPWVLISAGLVDDLRLTSYRTIRDDLVNAGAEWVDAEVVVDGGLVTSRQPDDIPAFNREMIRVFGEHRGRGAHRQVA
jgi:protease I